MYIDSSSYPLVRIGYERDKAVALDQLLVEFSALLDRGQVLVFFSDGDISWDAHSPEERKKVVIWMKAHRPQLHDLVRAQVHAEPDADKRAQVQVLAQAFSQAWGYPMLLAASMQEARQRALLLLKGG